MSMYNTNNEICASRRMLNLRKFMFEKKTPDVHIYDTYVNTNRKTITKLITMQLQESSASEQQKNAAFTEVSVPYSRLLHTVYISKLLTAERANGQFTGRILFLIEIFFS